ncbi:J domain-containing protein [Trichothermofontia sp.]
MVSPTHYEVLAIAPTATQAEIKQAYRQLVRRIHPDNNRETADPVRLTQVNAAYEVLGNPRQRSVYDRRLHHQGKPHGAEPNYTSAWTGQSQRAATAQQHHRQQRQQNQACDQQWQDWLQQVYTPVDRLLYGILTSLRAQIDELAADPFDDDLMLAFQDYLESCRSDWQAAQRQFRSRPNPKHAAGVAVHLYYCLDRVGDGLDELEAFPFNYNDQHLHTGQELFRIAAGLRREAQAALGNLRSA